MQTEALLQQPFAFYFQFTIVPLTPITFNVESVLERSNYSVSVKFNVKTVMRIGQVDASCMFYGAILWELAAQSH